MNKKHNQKIKNIMVAARTIFKELADLPLTYRIATINRIRKMLSKYSPFKDEPVDCVLWKEHTQITANDYNPNKVAPPEMKLLEHSILSDGYTQPIVTWTNGEDHIEVIDGFHRHRVGRENEEVKTKIHGYLPIVLIKQDRKERNNRIASTIRHNRARGKHQIESMSDIVIELKNRNWKNERIARELGMEQDEVLRLLQITGLADLFSDEDFSRSWDVDNSDESGFENNGIFEFIPLDDINLNEDNINVRTVNTNDSDRIFHTHDKWECHKAGFYNTTFEGIDKDKCLQAYADFLSNNKRFSDALNAVINEWKFSCEHYLTNASMNRIAWLGQASMCYATGVPSKFCGGYNLLSTKQQEKADRIALRYLNKWLINHGFEKVTIETAETTRQSTIY